MSHNTYTHTQPLSNTFNRPLLPEEYICNAFNTYIQKADSNVFLAVPTMQIDFQVFLLH